MEIFGLVIIVILLTLGLLFTIVVLTKQPTQEVQRVKESIQAANFLNTIVGTTSVGCGQRTVRELLQNCALSNEDWIGAAQCNDRPENTCELARDMMEEMLGVTLKKWGKNYKFFINGTDAAERIIIESGPCTGEREGFSRPEVVTPGLDIVLTLHICR